MIHDEYCDEVNNPTGPRICSCQARKDIKRLEFVAKGFDNEGFDRYAAKCCVEKDLTILRSYIDDQMEIKDVTIYVNGVAKKLPEATKVLGYYNITRLAGYTDESEDHVVTITYSGGGLEGVLLKNKIVPLRNGTHFTAIITGNA